MMSIRFNWIIFIFFFAVQSLTAQIKSDTIENLNILYQEFRYPEVIQTAENILIQDSSMSVSQKCEILRLLSLSYFAQQDMQGALKNFAMILNLDPNYRLDPVKNSPKILAFFEEIRKQMVVRDALAKKPVADDRQLFTRSVNTDSLEQKAYEHMAMSFLLPGSGHIIRGEKTKGWILAGGNAILLGTFIYFNAEVNRLEDIYLRTSNPSDIPAAYEDYNQAYRGRNLVLTGFIAIWLYTQIDFIFISASKPAQNRLSWYPLIDHTGFSSLNLRIHF